ncbi:major facilitator superfamily domain-containing protein [Phialemonium atrogriseum]|uniref:Major facilitator superfamily domain-containing protein n=1 Tax=Phialemonium atrogriseum TaxID=1093897 RepID=A0AAJ0C075_9PEZI|nr:major facilitator superfamily domain-containing protein [Phialemonium atrogriseum]KAK1766339.1 major facilitator superfamily domain-containing protein [Phialemonium atrogriseum]
MVEYPELVGKEDKDKSGRRKPTESEHLPRHGQGTLSDPFVVEFRRGDPRNPMNFSATRKWLITSVVTISVFAVTLTSSAYSASSEQITAEFGASRELFALGVSLYVLGFAVGPALWAPLSELYGRQILFVTTHAFVVAFVAASAGCRSMAQLLVFRFLAGTFAASPLTNSGGVIADLFPSAQRGLAMSVFAAAPFMGPMLGPVVGGFITITVGWRWVQGVCCIFVGVVWIVGSALLPETYPPVLLQRRAKRLSQETGKVYISVLERNTGGVELSEVFGKAIKRPWVLLFCEPIVLIASVYLAILYGTIYMFMGAFPIVYEKSRGWNAGIGGLAFLGLTIGMLFGLLYTILDNGRYKKLGKGAPPEARLPPGMIGAVALPVGMFAFAWTNSPSIHWSASIILSAPFGFGCVLVFLSCLNFLLDAYTIYAASVLAAGAMLRAFFGAAFPLFVAQMYERLGVHWASSVPAFLTVACLPFPFVVYKYGAALRMRCKYAQEAAVLMSRLQASEVSSADEESSSV